LTTERLAPTRIDRVLNWDACLNVRDLGGLRTKDGRTIRWGALVRSDLLCRLTEAGRRGPVEHGIIRKLATPSREAMLEALAHLAAVHGPAEAYLRAGGLTDDQMARLRSRLLD
jgi:hypothetical protein